VRHASDKRNSVILRLREGMVDRQQPNFRLARFNLEVELAVRYVAQLFQSIVWPKVWKLEKAHSERGMSRTDSWREQPIPPPICEALRKRRY
jgi:hypothetical protein